MFGDMQESNGSFKGMLLENVNKEIPINFSLLTTPVKDTPIMSKAFTICKLENYMDKSYGEAAKMQMKQDTLIKFAVFTIKFLLLKVKVKVAF